jgi:hypothetical protein
VASAKVALGGLDDALVGKDENGRKWSETELKLTIFHIKKMVHNIENENGQFEIFLFCFHPCLWGRPVGPSGPKASCHVHLPPICVFVTILAKIPAYKYISMYKWN